MKTILLLGDGQLGRSLEKTLKPHYDVVVLSRKKTGLDFTNIRGTVKQIQDEIDLHAEVYAVINTIAYTNVDSAEKNGSVCNTVNSLTPSIVAAQLEEFGIKFIHFSTDFAYNDPFFETTLFKEDDKTTPLNVYATTKVKGDQTILNVYPDAIILRVGGIFQSLKDGISPTCFVGKIASLANRESINVVDDQFTSPTPVDYVSEAVLKILQSERWIPGLFNWGTTGTISFYELAKLVLKNQKTIVNPVSTERYAELMKTQLATRPKHCAMDHTKIMMSYNLAGHHFENFEEDYTL